MYFWHWARSLDAKGGPIAKMTHGVQLCPRWNGIGSPPVCTSPPFIGTPALEVTHPFHFKMTPSMLLGLECNHDLGILLRLVDASAPSTDIEQVRGSLLDAIGDHEFYCASYSSKEQPHMEGLLTTLIDGMKAKEVAHCVLERNLKVLQGLLPSRRSPFLACNSRPSSVLLSVCSSLNIFSLGFLCFERNVV